MRPLNKEFLRDNLLGLSLTLIGTVPSLEEIRALEAVRMRCADSEDHAEALRAWAEKRKPVFHGR